MNTRRFTYLAVAVAIIETFLAIWLYNQGLSHYQMLVKFWPWYTVGAAILIVAGGLHAHQEHRFHFGSREMVA